MRQFVLALGVLALSATAAASGKESSLGRYKPVYSFKQFPAKVTKLKKFHEPIIASRHARYYQSSIRYGAQQGPDFAGHIAVANWGCGTCCNQYAFVNLISGRVWAPYFGVQCGPVGDEPEDTWAFDITHSAVADYQKDSNLFVVYGSMGDSNCAAVHYFVWQKDRLKKIKKDGEICRKPRG